MGIGVDVIDGVGRSVGLILGACVFMFVFVFIVGRTLVPFSCHTAPPCVVVVDWVDERLHLLSASERECRATARA